MIFGKGCNMIMVYHILSESFTNFASVWQARKLDKKPGEGNMLSARPRFWDRETEAYSLYKASSSIGRKLSAGFSLTNTPCRLFFHFRLLFGKFFSSIEVRAFRMNASCSLPPSVLGEISYPVFYSHVSSCETTVKYSWLWVFICEFATAFPHTNDSA